MRNNVSYANFFNLMHQFIDFVIVTLLGEILFRNHFHLALIIGALLLLFIFRSLEFYHSFREKRLKEMSMAIFLALAVWFFCLKIFFWFVHLHLNNHIFCCWVALVGIYFFTKQYFLILLARFLRTKGYSIKRIALLGDAALVDLVLFELHHHQDLGYKVIKVIKNYSKKDHLSMRSETFEQLWIAYPLEQFAKVKEVMMDFNHSPRNIRFITDISDLGVINQSISQIGALPIINIRSTAISDPCSHFIKATEDRVLAAAILLLVSPFMLLVALCIKLSSTGPIFYRQIRVSMNGDRFVMLKFRTMPINAEEKTGAVWAKPNENRATKLGAFLRKTSLDELPQFINVLKGNMSIVGPRPERPEFVEKFKMEIPLYMQKHLVKAGMTGLAQIHGWRGNTDLKKRIEYDLQYIQQWSLWLDVKIIVLTLFKGFVDRNAY